MVPPVDVSLKIKPLSYYKTYDIYAFLPTSIQGTQKSRQPSLVTCTSTKMQDFPPVQFMLHDDLVTVCQLLVYL